MYKVPLLYARETAVRAVRYAVHTHLKTRCPLWVCKNLTDIFTARAVVKHKVEFSNVQEINTLELPKLPKAKGMEKNKLDTARKMKSKGFSLADIADITGLTKEEIKNL